LPFRWDVETLTRGLNFTLTTSVGEIDLLGEVIGGGGYENCYRHHRSRALRRQVPLRDAAEVIALKRAAGGPRDMDALPNSKFYSTNSERTDDFSLLRLLRFLALIVVIL